MQENGGGGGWWRDAAAAAVVCEIKKWWKRSLKKKKKCSPREWNESFKPRSTVVYWYTYLHYTCTYLRTSVYGDNNNTTIRRLSSSSRSSLPRIIIICKMYPRERVRRTGIYIIRCIIYALMTLQRGANTRAATTTTTTRRDVRVHL